jgi:hypothetical protein
MSNGYTYKGWTYTPWDEYEEDNIKRWHEFVSLDGQIIHCDFSPYARMSEEDVRLWIDLGCPERIHYRPLDSADLKSLRREQLETITALNATFTD